jgi:hypothetical protein
MPDETKLSPEEITRILLRASTILATEGSGSKFKALVADLKQNGVGQEVIDLVQSKVSRLPPGWAGKLWDRVKGLGQVFGIRQVGDFFGPGFQTTWKVIITACLAALASLHAMPKGASTPSGNQSQMEKSEVTGNKTLLETSEAATFPPHDSGRRTQTYFTSPHSGIHIMRAPADMIVNGPQNRWAAAHFISNGCLDDLAGQYSFRGAMMWDEHALYINAFDPAQEKEPDVWKGGAIQIHLAMNPVQPDEIIADQTNNEKLVKLTLWKPIDGKPCLMVSRKMKDGTRSNGEFKICAEGQFSAEIQKSSKGGQAGYSLEYAIPWSTLATDGITNTCPFKVGQVSRTVWEIHWSDAKGENFRGKLVDVVNQKNEKNAYETADAWGLAYFDLAP